MTISFCKTKNLANVIKVDLALLLIAFVILFFLDPGHFQLNLFFHRGADLFADFFNHISYVADRNPYFSQFLASADHNGPPLYYLFAYFFKFAADYPSKLDVLWSSPEAMASAIAYMLFSETVLFYFLYKLANREKKEYTILPLLFFSGINLAAIERGTTVIFTAGCIAGFIYLYEQPERKKQILSLLLLSLAAALKIYPALFGLLLLKKRDFTGIAICIIATAAMGFLPLLFFEHQFGNIPKIFDNLACYRSEYRYSAADKDIAGILCKLFSLSKPAAFKTVDIFHILLDVAVISSCIKSFFSNSKEKLLLSTAGVLILCPIGAMRYTQLYLFPVFLLFLERIKKSYTQTDILSAFCYIVLLTPLQFEYISPYTHITFLPLLIITTAFTCSDSKKNQQIGATSNG